MKVLAAHQTYFFPYIGYYSVLNRADIMVHMDSFQFEKRSWMNRNRIIGANGEVKYIIVPTQKNHRSTPNNEIVIDYSQEWEKTIINQFGYYLKRAPYYKEVMGMLEELFDSKYDNLSELAMKSTELVLKRLGIKKDIYKTSDLKVLDEGPHEPDEWGIVISKKFPDVDVYINAPGGKSFYDVNKYEKAGLKIEFMQNRLTPYDQGNDEFIPGLSILDVMMFNSPEQIKPMLEDYYIL